MEAAGNVASEVLSSAVYILSHVNLSLVYYHRLLSSTMSNLWFIIDPITSCEIDGEDLPNR